MIFKKNLVVLLAALIVACGVGVMMLGCSNTDEEIGTKFDGTGNFYQEVQKTDIRFSIGLRDDEEVFLVKSGQLEKRNGKWVISVEWLPKYQERLGDLEIKAVGTYLPDEIKNATASTNVTLLIQGKNVYEETKEEEQQSTAIYDPGLGGWVEEGSNFAVINKQDSLALVTLFSDALNDFATNNGSSLKKPINLLVEFKEVVIGEYEEIVDFNSALRAEPEAAFDFEQPTIPSLDSWTDGERNYHIIYLGFIRNQLLMQMGPFEWTGVPNLRRTYTESVTNTMGNSRTDAVSTSVRVSQSSSKSSSYSIENTTSLETIRHEALNSGISGGAGWGPFSAKADIKHTLENTTTNFNSTTTSFNYETSTTFNTSEQRSTATETSTMESISKTVSNTIELEVISGVHPVGHYRYAWYSISDIYLVVSTSLDNQNLLSLEAVSCVRDYGSERAEYSIDGRFDNSPNSDLIVLPQEFWKRLPSPIITFVKKEIRETFTSSDNYSLPSNIRFPAEVEIYALGGGGGGQGGHTASALNVEGTGGAGGGGAAIYARLYLDNSENFRITVGRGGGGGSGILHDVNNDWRSGNMGEAGHKSLVSKNNGDVIIEANGGDGGGSLRSSANSYRELNGGYGGEPKIINADWSTFGNGVWYGGRGETGSQDKSTTSRGGSAGRISADNTGSLATTFGGGAGGTSGNLIPAQRGGGGGGGYSRWNNGSPGGGGEVVIIITWWE